MKNKLLNLYNRPFLKPNLTKLIVWTIFIFIMIVGYSMTWAFGDHSTPEPFLSQILGGAGVPFWVIWSFLTLPLTPLWLATGVFTLINDSLWVLSSGLYVLIQLIYFYLLACFFTLMLKKLKQTLHFS
jgi:hypothetical protein